ncbi:hypothetical protein CCACVL1_03161 [Corchorus capsularis]|uniref:Uncharacterized protein n=1 Tax=Corchorus capsularis TaxID=210143 RepID=A0A1R3K1Z7_COCAP|nr:hypothetical protein CCACVL1_03161 [Corchorus capsularis]
MANNSAAIPTTAIQNSKPFVKKRSTRSSKQKPKIPVLKIKYGDKILCNVSSRSDELAISKSIKTHQPQQPSDIVDLPKPKKMNIVVPAVEKKEVPKKKKKRSYITLLGRKEIEQDILKIAEALGRRKRARRSKKQSTEHKRTLAFLFPGSQYLKSID